MGPDRQMDRGFLIVAIVMMMMIAMIVMFLMMMVLTLMLMMMIMIMFMFMMIISIIMVVWKSLLGCLFVVFYGLYKIQFRNLAFSRVKKSAK